MLALTDTLNESAIAFVSWALVAQARHNTTALTDQPLPQRCPFLFTSKKLFNGRSFAPIYAGCCLCLQQRFCRSRECSGHTRSNEILRFFVGLLFIWLRHYAGLP